MSARTLFTMEQPAFDQCDDMTVDSCDAGIKFNPNTRMSLPHCSDRGFPEKVLADGQMSLRALVEHWLAPGKTQRVRVVEFRNNRVRQQCYVRVEVLKTGERMAMFFFRHQDGIWRVFPPARVRPAMGCSLSFTR